jgi:RNA polymerase sigma-70 factor (ECF subfamily)
MGSFDVASERSPGSMGMSVSPDTVAARAATEERFELFYRSEYRSVLKLVRPLTRSLNSAEDVAQEAFLRALRNWKDVGEHPNPEAWIRRVALNLACSRWRRLRAEASAVMRIGQAPFDGSAPLHNQELWAAVAGLSMRQQQVVLLFYVDDLSVRGIAEVLGIKEGTVKATLHHARARLAKTLGVHHDD